MTENSNLAIIGIAVFLLAMIIAWIIGCLNGEKQIKQNRKEEEESNAEKGETKKIEENDKPKELHKTTRAFCNDNLKEYKVQKSKEEKATDKVVARVTQENKKGKERQKPEEDKKSRTKEILKGKSALSKIIVETWLGIKEKGHCERVVTLKRKKLLKHKDVTICTDEERMKIIFEGINTDIIPTSELFEKYVVSSLEVLAEEGTSRPNNKERLREILKRIGTIIVNPSEHEPYVVTNALGELSKKKITIRTNGERLKKALEKIQNIKKFWSNSRKVPLSLINALREQEEEIMVIHVIGDKPKKLPSRVHIAVKNIEGLERDTYLLIDLTEKERKNINEWIMANYSD